MNEIPERILAHSSIGNNRLRCYTSIVTRGPSTEPPYVNAASSD